MKVLICNHILVSFVFLITFFLLSPLHSMNTEKESEEDVSSYSSRHPSTSSVIENNPLGLDRNVWNLIGQHLIRSHDVKNRDLHSFTHINKFFLSLSEPLFMLFTVKKLTSDKNTYKKKCESFNLYKENSEFFPKKINLFWKDIFLVYSFLEKLCLERKKSSKELPRFFFNFPPKDEVGHSIGNCLEVVLLGEKVFAGYIFKRNLLEDREDCICISEDQEIDDIHGQRAAAFVDGLRHLIPRPKFQGPKLYKDIEQCVYIMEDLKEDSREKNYNPLFFKKLRGNKSLIGLSFESFGISSDIDCLCKFLRQNYIPNLKSLNIRDNNLSNIDCCKLAEALEKNTILMSLNLSHNFITDIGVGALIMLVGINTSLEELDLQNTHVGAYAEALITREWKAHKGETKYLQISHAEVNYDSN